MNEEFFDVVDSADQVIGRDTRSRVHALGLNHRAVHILLWNAVGEVFLQLRSVHKDKFPDCWDSSCSGHVDSGEDYDSAADRELGEELGLPNFGAQLQFLFKIEAREETGREFVHVYGGRHDGPFSLDPREISEGGFFSAEEVDAWIALEPSCFAPAFLYLWPKARGAKIKG